MASNTRNAARVAAAIALALALNGASAQAPSAQPATPPPAVQKAKPYKETTIPVIASGKWNGPRTPDGQPDISGHWSNTIANHNNFEDPNGSPPAERQTASVRPAAGARQNADGTARAKAPSRVTDPADGRIPFQPWARAAQEDHAAHADSPRDGADIEPLARCAPAGVPKSFYWHGYEIRQYPGYILFLFNSGSRIIHLNNPQHLPSNIKLWNADSRGHWEGNTLVVDVSNDNAKALFGREYAFASENVHIVERYIFASDGQRYNYVATFEDPSVYTGPWTATVPAHKYDNKDVELANRNGWDFEVQTANHDGKGLILEREERICVENNGPFGGGEEGVGLIRY